MTDRTITEYSVHLVRDREVPYQNAQVCGSGEASQILHAILDDSPVERMVVLYLNGANRVQGFEVISLGGLVSASTSPGEVFRGAILHCARGIVVGHNHPSGDPTPSSDDVRITDAIGQCGDLLGIHLLDHIIVCPGRTFSMMEEGFIGRQRGAA